MSTDTTSFPIEGRALKRMLKLGAGAAMMAALLTACGGAPPTTPVPVTPAPESAPAPSPAPAPVAISFPEPPRTEAGAIGFTATTNAVLNTWRADYAARAEASGRDPGAIYALLEGIAPHPAFLAPGVQPESAIASQAEFAEPIWEYVSKRVSEGRKSRGQLKVEQLESFFDGMEAQFGVDRDSVASIWGMETNFGSFMGTDDAGETLASMAAEGRRRSFAEGELTALLLILESGEAERDDLVSGWAGAMGHTQFMPTTYRRLAVDYDGDGRKDLWDSPEDALASAANYLATEGYVFGRPWGIEVGLPADFDYALANGTERPVREWATLGVIPVGGGTFEVGGDTRAELWLPAGHRGPKYLLTNNFDVFRTYNRSNSYALSVGLLADAIAGRPGPQTPWPTDLQPLTVGQIKQLQSQLNQLGYNAGPVDGIAGSGTRGALQRFQSAYGYVADGFPTTEALAAVNSVLTNPQVGTASAPTTGAE